MTSPVWYKISLASQALANLRTRFLRYRRIIAVISYAVVVAIIFFAIGRLTPELPDLTWHSGLVFAGMAILALPTWILRGASTVVALRLAHSPRTFYDGYRIAVWNTVANLFPFSPGIAVRGLMLNHLYSVPVGEYLLIAIYLFSMEIGASGVMGIMGLLILEMDHFWLWIGFGLMGLLLVPLVFERPFQFIRWIRIRGCPLRPVDFDRPWAILLLMNLLVIGLESLRLDWAFSIVRAPTSYAVALVLSSATILMRFVNITPGGIGIRETIIVALATTTGIPLETAIMAAVIDRIAGLSGLLFSVSSVVICDYHQPRTSSPKLQDVLAQRNAEC